MSVRRAYQPAGAGIAVGTLAAATLLVALAVGIASLWQAPTYEASARVWVDQRDSTLLAGERQTFTQAMTMAVNTRPVAEGAIGRLGLRMGPDELLDNLTAEQVEGSTFIRLTYTDADPRRAKQVVNAVGEAFSELAAANKITATLHDAATVPDTPVSPAPLRNGLLAAGLGLFLCVGLALRPIHPTA